MTVAEWRAARPIDRPQTAAQARPFPLDYGVVIALATGLLFAIIGGVTMLASMPDGLRGSFIGAVFAAVGVLLAGVGASIHTEIEQTKEIVFGWGPDEDDPDYDAYPELAERFGWTDETVARLKRLHASFKALARP